MKRSSFRHISLSQSKRRQLTVQQFGGVDYTSGSLLASDARATDMRNIVRRDGFLQKRHGHEKILQSGAVSYVTSSEAMASLTNYGGVNGIWRFEAEDGLEHIIAHIGFLLFEIHDIDGDAYRTVLSTGTHPTLLVPITYKFENAKSFAFVGRKMLWFLGGNRYMRIRFPSVGQMEMTPVDESPDTFEPLTTMSIVPNGVDLASARHMVNSPNLLSRYRKNGLVGGEFANLENGFREYTLDAPIVKKTSSDRMSVSIEEKNFDESVFNGADSTHRYMDGYMEPDQNPIEKTASETYQAPTGAVRGSISFEAWNRSVFNNLVDGVCLFGGQETTQSNLVGSGGSFKLIVKWFNTSGPSNPIRTDEFTLNQWMENFAGNKPFNVYYLNGSDLSDAPSSGDDSLCFVLSAVDGSTNIVVSGCVPVEFVDFDEMSEELIGSGEYCVRKVTSGSVVDVDYTQYGDDIPDGSYFIIDKKAEEDYQYDVYYGAIQIKTTALSDGRRIFSAKISHSDVTDGPYRVLGYIPKNSVSTYQQGADYSSKTSNVVLFDDIVSPIGGQSNVEIRFPVYDPDSADLINKCRFGILFGNQNARNRLFVSGNPDHKNKDWHTGSSYDVLGVDKDGDFSYFPDTSYCVYGETDNAVCGYSIVSNDKLLVLKTESDKETTVYFRSPTLVLATNSANDAILDLSDSPIYREEFSVVKGNNSIAGVSPHTIVNMNGDTLFASSEKKVMGLDLTGMVGDSQRYASTRSLYIDRELSRQSITNMWTDGTMTILSCVNEAFVCYYDAISDSQYEWFPLDIEHSTCFLKRNGTLYYGDSYGAIHKFTDSFQDVDKYFVSAALSVNDQDEVIVYMGSGASFFNGDYFRPIEDGDGYLYGKLMEITSESDTVSVYDYMSSKIPEGSLVFLDDIEAGHSEVFVGQGYAVSYGPDGGRVRLLLNGVAVVNDLSAIPCVVCQRLEGEYPVIDVDTQNKTFKLKGDDGEPIDLVDYGTQTDVSIRGELIIKRPVKAFLITKAFSMGSIEHLKTIWSITLSNDSGMPSSAEVCWVSNKIPSERMRTIANVGADALVLDFDSLSFTAVDFDKNEAPRSYTRKRIISGVRYLCLGMRNYSDTNMVVGPLAITYTIPYPNYQSD